VNKHGLNVVVIGGGIAGLTSFCSNGIVFPILKELGIDGKRPFERVYRQVSWDGADVPLREGAQVERRLAGIFPEDSRGLHSYFRLVAEGERWMQAFERSNIYLGLSAACAGTGALDRFQENHVLFFSRSGQLIQLVLLTKDDPTLAPPGKQALCISAFSPYEQWQPWMGNHDAAYRACKEAEARRLIRLTEEFIPGLSNYIEEVDAATPLTYERYTGNWQGASVGWSWDPAGNPRMNFKKDFPSLHNFYLAGHWTFRLGGMLSAMITARYAALEVIKKVISDK
jgi:hypothetical protein